MQSDLKQDTPGGTSQNPYQLHEEVLPKSDEHGSQVAELVVEHAEVPDSQGRDNPRKPGETKSFSRHRPLAVVVGMNSTGEALVEELCRTQRPGMNILGYISEPLLGSPLENPSEFKAAAECAEAGTHPAHEDIDTHSASLNGSGSYPRLPILGGRDVLSFLIENGLIDIIIMAVDYKAHPELFQQAIEATQRGISVIPLAMVYERLWSKVPIKHLGDQWYAALPSEIRFRPLYICWSKVLDISFALVGMAVLLLLLPVLALLIYLESPGPIFYSQERLGYQGRKFFIHKFRSMYTDAECAGHPKWASEDDPRVMRIGRFLRATHVDELPQVLNILRGEMSLIGPRPERALFVSQLAKTIPFYLCRLSVKPGLTGWAQVKYSYASSNQDALEKLQYDLYYIKHQSPALDIRIILMTIVEMLLCRGR